MVYLTTITNAIVTDYHRWPHITGTTESTFHSVCDWRWEHIWQFEGSLREESQWVGVCWHDDHKRRVNMRVSCYETKTGVPYEHKEKTKRTNLYSILSMTWSWHSFQPACSVGPRHKGIELMRWATLPAKFFSLSLPVQKSRVTPLQYSGSKFGSSQ